MRILKRFFATLCVVIVIIFVLYFWFHIDTVKIEGGSVYSDSEIEKSVFCRKLRFFFFIFSVLSMAVFSVQDAQSQRFLPVENSPAPPCSISMGGKSGGYTYYIG